MTAWRAPRQSIPWRTLRDPGHFLSLGGGTGLLPWTPGSWGSLVGVGAFYLLDPLGEVAYWGVLSALWAVGIPLCGRTSRALGVKDHGAIVWDEIVGVMIALGLCGTSLLAVGLGFATFRILDIWKPWPISLLDQRLEGGLGVMADDLAAGVFAGLAILLFKYLS